MEVKILRDRERYGKRQKEVNKMRDKSDGARKRQKKKTKSDRDLENDNYTHWERDRDKFR